MKYCFINNLQNNSHGTRQVLMFRAKVTRSFLNECVNIQWKVNSNTTCVYMVTQFRERARKPSWTSSQRNKGKWTNPFLYDGLPLPFYISCACLLLLWPLSGLHRPLFSLFGQPRKPLSPPSSRLLRRGRELRATWKAACS